MAMQLFTGKEYLKLDIANNFGLDKEDWSVRLAWFDSHEHELHKLISKAEEPALFYAGIQAWEAAKEGRPSGYPISLDATASGIQISSVLTCDRKAASACNVIDVGKRMDAYVHWYNIMVDKIGGKASIDRKQTKKAFMTAFYNSVAVPERVFGKGELLDIFYETMEEEAPGAWELNQAMLELWDPEAYINQWVMPDNFHVRIKVMAQQFEHINFMGEEEEITYSVNAPTPKGRSLGANMHHSVDGMVVREVVRRCDHDPKKLKELRHILENKLGGLHDSGEDDKMVKIIWGHYIDSGFLSSHILDFLTKKNAGWVDEKVVLEMMDTFPKKPFKVLTVHDCFRCLPNYGNDLRMQYNQILSDIAKSNLLSFIISQIAGKYMPVNKLNPEMWSEVLEANYALS